MLRRPYSAQPERRRNTSVRPYSAMPMRSGVTAPGNQSSPNRRRPSSASYVRRPKGNDASVARPYLHIPLAFLGVADRESIRTIDRTKIRPHSAYATTKSVAVNQRHVSRRERPKFAVTSRLSTILDAKTQTASTDRDIERDMELSERLRKESVELDSPGSKSGETVSPKLRMKGPTFGKRPFVPYSHRSKSQEAKIEAAKMSTDFTSGINAIVAERKKNSEERHVSRRTHARRVAHDHTFSSTFRQAGKNVEMGNQQRFCFLNSFHCADAILLRDAHRKMLQKQRRESLRIYQNAVQHSSSFKSTFYPSRTDEHILK